MVTRRRQQPVTVQVPLHFHHGVLMGMSETAGEDVIRSSRVLALDTFMKSSQENLNFYWMKKKGGNERRRHK